MNDFNLKKAGRLTSLFMKPYKGKYISAIVLTIFSAMAGGLNPFIIGLCITELTSNVKAIKDGVPGAAINYNYIIMMIAIFIVVIIIRQAGSYLSNYVLAGGVQNSFKDLRMEISRKMNRLPVSYFDTHKQGNVLNVITNDVDTVSTAMQQGLLQIITSVTTIIVYYTMMMVISVKLGLLALLMIPISLLISRVIMKRSQKNFLAMQNTLADINGFIQERYSGFTIVKLYNDEEHSIEEFKKINSKLNEAGYKATFQSSLMGPFIELLVNATYVTMVLLSGMAVFGGLAIGSMQAFVQYIWQIYEPLSQMTQLSTAFQSAIASMGRIVTFLDEKEEVVTKSTVSNEEIEEVRGDIKFQNVKFSYKKNSPLIKDLSFEAKPGQTIAIVGETGAGKTTIINLLMRFYDIDDGEILIDGKSIYDMSREQSRSLFGMVLQDAWLYNATIFDNIRFGRLDATSYEVVEAAKAANVDHFIKTLPGGYNMMINEEGSNVSLGQKQLLTIARAMIADPKILILDEATSSVDTRLEMLIQQAMKKATEGRTSFVIAHRLSTIREADLILVLSKGDIVEKGTHLELLEQKGIYEKLYNSQFAEE